ncbi:membrane protein [Salmonella enterica subsp. enterica serovar Typhimurium]|nr:membrane protein [Salmonella enterica subsp. enterica serovar Typhimurium]
MTPFTQSQRIKALFWLSLFHLLVIISSNYLVQLPITIFGFHTTWGAFSFPFIFSPPILPCVFLAHRWRAALSSPS